MPNPLWSLCHATARLPWGWKPAYEAWRANCADWAQVEYILGVDLTDEGKWYPILPILAELSMKIAVNRGRQCAVDGWNATGKAATGKFLITVADDLYPPPNWDVELLKVLEAQGDWPNREIVLEVKSGTDPADAEWRRCLIHSFLTRPYYERLGNFFDPRFEGMYADDWFSEVARFHGVVVDARHLQFTHRHYIGTCVPFDEIYQRQNSDERYARGLQILGDVRAAGYPK